MSRRRPSGLAPDRVGVRGLQWEVDVDRELEEHRAVFRSLRRTVLVVLVVLTALTIVLAATGRTTAAGNVALYSYPFVPVGAMAVGVGWWMRHRERPR